MFCVDCKKLTWIGAVFARVLWFSSVFFRDCGEGSTTWKLRDAGFWPLSATNVRYMHIYSWFSLSAPSVSVQARLPRTGRDVIQSERNFDPTL